MSEHELWNEVGNLYFLSGEYQQAVFAYKRAIQMDAEFGRPYSNLALTYVQLGKFDQAIDLYRRSIELLLEDKEKAISWNRLGDVYRHLKEYQQAVVAYRSADELDVEEAENERPGWIADGVSDGRADRSTTAEKPMAVTDEPFPYAPAKAEPEPALEAAEDPNATWAPMDPSLFQQDTFEALDPGVLTTWGDPSLDVEEPDAGWAPDTGADVEFPDLDGDELTRWFPVPEEQPVDSLEYTLEAVDLAAEMDEPPEAPIDTGRLEWFSDLKPEPPDPVIPTVEASKAVEIAGLLTATSQSHAAIEAAQRAVTTTDLDIIVEERPTTEFLLAAEAEAPTSVETSATEFAPSEREAGPVEATAASAPEAAATVERCVEAPQAERDPEELRQIEAGLAKYKRVVQVNPRNARAWDTLGNLYKSAGQYKEALLAYERAIENDPSKALFHHHAGLVYACEGRIDEAIEAFQKVIEMEPDHALAHATLGGYYRKKGLEELAQKHVGIAMKSIFDSENEYNRACLAAICGDTDQALDLLRVALMNKQTYVDWILRDPDLDFIRQDPRFKQLVSDYAG
ncbi:MAG TPA: tetratricopeptide repeat protein [Anaerolineales bacterium]